MAPDEIGQVTIFNWMRPPAERSRGIGVPLDLHLDRAPDLGELDRIADHVLQGAVQELDVRDDRCLALTDDPDLASRRLRLEPGILRDLPHQFDQFDQFDLLVRAP